MADLTLFWSFKPCYDFYICPKVSPAEAYFKPRLLRSSLLST
jgi:hypothetical protein